jgi:hypothetical protein
MTLGRAATAVAGVALALGVWSVPGASASPRPAAATGHRLVPSRAGAKRGARRRSQTGRAMPDWLATINRYRIAAGLSAVSDQPAWDAGLEQHLTYLARTPAQYSTGQYRSAHTENPASPFYTAHGATEAAYSDLVQGAAFTPLQALDEWLTAPFHAIGMLRAQLQRVALVDDVTTGDAGLDVIHGLNYNLPATTTPILFPGPGVTTDLLSFGGERPSPLETCGWQQSPPVGLPLIVLLPRSPLPALSASLTGPTGVESTADAELCVVDEHTFRSADAVYGPSARYILSADNAVVLIPRDPLTNGRYIASVRQPGTPEIRWTFSADAPRV